MHLINDHDLALILYAYQLKATAANNDPRQLSSTLKCLASRAYHIPRKEAMAKGFDAAEVNNACQGSFSSCAKRGNSPVYR